nr:unnamed protein product [Brassica rapa]
MQSTRILSTTAVEATSPLNHHHPGSYQAQRVLDGQRYKDGFRQVDDYFLCSVSIDHRK